MVAKPKKKAKKKKWDPSKRENPILGFWYKLYTDPTPCEVLFEPAAASLGIPYRTQHPFGGKWFMDYCFPTLKLCIELDGESHDTERQQEQDKLKTEYLESKGWTVFRVKNHWVLKCPYKCLDYVMRQLKLPYRTLKFDDRVLLQER